MWNEVSFDDETLEVRINGIVATRVCEPSLGPVMIEHKFVLDGRPTSLYDVFNAKRTGNPHFKWNRTVPVDRNFSRPPIEVATRPDLFEEVHHSDLHQEFMASLKWRGRPSSFLAFRIDVLRDWRDKVFSGDLTIRDLAKRAGVAYPAAHRFAHGETLWWL